jgi:hypothetical protein
MTSVMAELNQVVGALPSAKAQEVLDFARSLEQKQSALPVDESMEWSDEDLREWMKSGNDRLDEFAPAIPETDEDLREWSLDSLRRFESDHPDQDWGGLFEKPAESIQQNDSR